MEHNVGIFPGKKYIEIQPKTIPCELITTLSADSKIRIATHEEVNAGLQKDYSDQVSCTLTSKYKVEIPGTSRRMIYTGISNRLQAGTVAWVTGLHSLALEKMIDVVPIMLDS